MLEKLTIFPYGQYIVGIYVSLAFRGYSQVRNRCCVLREISKNVTVDTGKMDDLLQGAAATSWWWWRLPINFRCTLPNAT